MHSEHTDVCDCTCTYYWHAISSNGACKGKWGDAGCECDTFVLAYYIYKNELRKIKDRNVTANS